MLNDGKDQLSTSWISFVLYILNLNKLIFFINYNCEFIKKKLIKNTYYALEEYLQIPK